MDVILLEKVGNLGNIGDKVSVKAGFGRNYLIPHGQAVLAPSNNLVDFAPHRSEFAKWVNLIFLFRYTLMSLRE